MNPTCLARQAFDSEAFAVDYYRVVNPAPEPLGRELDALAGPFMADAKLDAQDIEGSKALQRLGFRKVCTQPAFVLDLAGARGAAAGEPQAACALPETDLAAHAANFPFSRFGLDPMIAPEERTRHQARWIANTMASPDVLKFLDNGAFVSFKIRDAVAVIDLISVLPAARGRGSLLLGRLKAWAAARGLKRIEVTTESENVPACLFYQKNGYRLERASVALHMRK
ncbi:dTDP-fucosamine acetyltransferase [Fundidesulfovibrio magnetotacticus]|uniref:dTDP-fucosamine acetyltransferase n=1 Tax=Fundidesulfovibrio magnetotacticus TaxID=2730080 RepID=A0A6V8LNP3_9BACT|nr:GNAT family N-acetyltransferase [Fundidesulfovibrio magnetotacticus]GFK94222.1 dTDP-fucosamine acetyltransferase [Fundidesulfovibrio magnetotacticus]